MRGFTLPEVITVTLVAVLVGVLVLGIMIQNTRIFVSESQKVSQGVGSNDALLQIKSEIKQAKSVASTYTSGGITYTTAADTLVLKIPSIDSSGNTVDNTFDYAVFTIQSGNLFFKLFPDPGSGRPGANQLLAKNVNQINFRYLDLAGNDTQATAAIKIRVALTLQQKLGTNSESSIATSEANLRND